MKIHIKLYGDLKRFAPDRENEFDLVLPAGAVLSDLYARIDIPADLPHTVLINGRRPDEAATLKNLDVVVMFPQLCGG